MTQRTWLSSIVLAVVVVVSMVVGGVLAVNITGDGDGNGATVLAPTPPSSSGATTLPAVARDAPDATPEVAAATTALADLPALVEEVAPSVVQIRARGQNGGGVGSGVVIDRSDTSSPTTTSCRARSRSSSSCPTARPPRPS